MRFQHHFTKGGIGLFSEWAWTLEVRVRVIDPARRKEG